MKNIDLRDYVCAVPFSSLEVGMSGRFLCCNGWLKKNLPENSSPHNAWNSKEAHDIRESILDGSYRYCESKLCPFLNQLHNFGGVGRVEPIYHKNNLPPTLVELIDKHKSNELNSPRVVQFSFDESCNLKCPSCRVELIMASGEKIKFVKQNIIDIQNDFGNDVRTLYITGTGDPFVSVGFRDFLRDFDKEKWPLLEKIHLHTNATRWNKKMWDSMVNVHKYIKSCEISIDAATKDTYENKVRLNGDWNELIDNLKFISSIPTLKSVKTSFVVQTSNYKEMRQFYDLMYSIFGKKLNVYFGKILNWGTFTEEEISNHQVWKPSHPEHQDFLSELYKVVPQDNVWTNLQEFIKPSKSII